MQEWCEDYYQSCDTGEGCCLNCYDAKEGCLCYDCKCKKCYWYSSPVEYDGYKGHCDKTDELKAERKEEAKLYYQLEADLDWEKSEELQKENERVLSIIKSKGKIPNDYTCQKCKRIFITEEIHNIILDEKPICLICKK